MRRSACYVKMLLAGARAADMPVEQPTRVDVTVNVLASKALGLVLPPALRLRAGEVIE